MQEVGINGVLIKVSDSKTQEQEKNQQNNMLWLAAETKKRSKLSNIKQCDNQQLNTFPKISQTLNETEVQWRIPEELRRPTTCSEK